MQRYRTISKEASAEQIIERSRFIAYARPVASKEEAEAFFAEIRVKNRGATHHVPAYVIGEHSESQWASDDGEPQGSSGAPMMHMLVKEDLTNLAVIVTRYYGGVKLGTGGLVRAYTSSAKLAVEAAGVCRVIEMDVLSGKLDYSDFNKLQSMAEDKSFTIKDVLYEDLVTVALAVEPEQMEGLRHKLAELTGGTFSELLLTRELIKIS